MSVDGDFDCSDNQLTSLKSSPASIGGFFACSDNQLTNLECAPQSVGGDFYCYHNKGLGEYQGITNFKVIKEKLLSDKEKKSLSQSLDNINLKSAVLKL